MKKLLWALSVVLVMVIATGASADIRSDKSNTYSNDLGISSAIDSYSGDICVWAGSINYYTNKEGTSYPTEFSTYVDVYRNAYLVAGNPNDRGERSQERSGNCERNGG